MKINKKYALSFFIIITTIPAIILNFANHLMGNDATISNLKVSIIFLILWFLLSVYCGWKNEKSYKKFILIYWGISIITYLLVALSSIINFDGMILAPLAIWYYSPIYGLMYLNKGLSVFNLGPYTGFLISFLGYYIGYYIYKLKIIDNA
ncbi:hypothetical protein [Clostridium sp. HCS.1]|uniref:hypothetical protein n=1 Tax=Clostridium sp. HCS.1 TaxID=3238594 RepID=UPI003A10171C